MNVSARRERPSRAEIPLYHAFNNLSIDILHKFYALEIPKFVHFYPLTFDVWCVILNSESEVREMLEKIREYYEMEYRDTARSIEKSWCTDKKMAVWYAIQRCLGVAQFVQIAGVSFEEIETLYDEIKEKLEKLLDK